MSKIFSNVEIYGSGGTSSIFAVKNSGGTNVLSVNNNNFISVGNTININGFDTTNYPISIISARVDLTRMQLINGGAAQTDLQIATNNGGNSIYYGVSAINNAFIDNRTTGDLLFQNGGTTQMVFDTSGNLGINTTSPTAKLHVVGSSSNVTILGNILDNLGGWTHVASVESGNGFLFVENGLSTSAATSHRVEIQGGTGGVVNVFNNAGIIKASLKGQSGVNHLFVENDGGSGGIEVQSNGTFVAYQNVGIGTATPISKLHLVGNALIQGDVDITGNVNIVGSATTINTQTIQSADNNISLNYSGTHLTAIGGGITILSGVSNSGNTTLTTDVYGDWNSNVGLHLTGRSTDSNSNGFDVSNSSGSEMFSVRNDNKVLINTGNTSFYNTAGAAYLDIETYKSFKLRMSASYGDIMTVSHTVGDITLHRPTVIVGSPTPSGTNTLEVGTTNGASSIGVRNISLSSSASGYGMFAIGQQGTGGSYGSPTMRFIYSPLTFGFSANTTDNNLFRVGIGGDVVDTHRVFINDGLKVSGETYLIGSGSTSATYVLKAVNSGTTNLLSVRNDGSVNIGSSTSGTSGNLNIDRTNDGVALLQLTSDGETIFSVKRGEISAIANSYTLNSGGGGGYTLIGNANPTVTWNTIGLGNTLSIGGSIPTLSTTRPTMVIDAPLLGIGVGYPAATAKLDVSGTTGYNQLRLRTSYTPSASGDTNGNIGDIAWDNNYVYVKTNTGWGKNSLNYSSYPNVTGASFSQVGAVTTTFTVTGFTQDNNTYKVCVTPTNVLSAAAFYVNNKTTTSFDVVYLAGLTGTVTFDWILTQ